MNGFAEYDDYDGLGLAGLVRDGQVSASDLLEEAISRTEVADHDSTLVQRYRQAGLVIFGKTNSPELGLNPVTEPREFGPTRNPWNPLRTAGGSSGGAGAAVAAGILPIAHASDGGGSIRIPASCCGLVGLKPSRGRIPFGPDKAEGWAGQSSSHIVSRSVRDCAAMLDATAGSETGEAYAAPHHPGSFLGAAQAAPGSLRIAVSREKWGRGNYQPEILAGLEKTVSLLEGLGHRALQPDRAAVSLAAAALEQRRTAGGNDVYRRLWQRCPAAAIVRASGTGRSLVGEPAAPACRGAPILIS